MPPILCIGCFAFLRAIVKILFNLEAPLGYQDETGFHLGNDWRNI
jgi:hypothetical protein